MVSDRIYSYLLHILMMHNLCHLNMKLLQKLQFECMSVVIKLKGMNIM